MIRELQINTLIARQEIYNEKEEVCAYELLYREGNTPNVNHLNLTNGEAGVRATSVVISNLFTNLDIDTILGPYPAFINFNRDHLLQKTPFLLPKNRIVIELLENQIIDTQLVEVIQSMAKQGYRFALDDCLFQEDLIPLLPLVHIIKVDVLTMTDQQIAEQLQLFAPYYSGKLLAEKIETQERFNYCRELKFDYFQGYFFHRPNLIVGNSLSEHKVSLINLLTELNNPDVKLERVEEIIMQLPKLSYRILRLANSVAMYTRREIESLLDAIQHLGLMKVRDWIILLMISSMDEVRIDNLKRTLIRAKMCETLAKITATNAHQAYTVGLLSTLDAILNEPLDSLLAKICLVPELNQAILEYKGTLGSILRNIEYYEEGQFDRLTSLCSSDNYTKAYFLAIEYANEIIKYMR